MSVTPVPFGRRIAAIRASLGISQSKVAGISQPRLSRIETGEQKASASIIDRLSESLGRTAIDLVKGTDREGYYVSQRLKPEEREELTRNQRLRDATALEFVYLYYTRIHDLFEALYGGGVVPAFRGEEAYIELRSNCEKAIGAVECFQPGFGESMFFPDHLEPENDEDDMLLCWEYFGAELKKSLRHVQQTMQEYSDCFDPDSRNALVHLWNLDKMDETIAMLRQARIEAERRLWRRAEQLRQKLWATPNNNGTGDSVK